jgi:hypothetical protein
MRMRIVRTPKAQLSPDKVGESTRRADPVPNPFRVVEIFIVSPDAVLQAVTVHLQGVKGVRGRDVGFVTVPE